MDRLQSIEMSMVGMAKQEDLARLQENLIRVQENLTHMATKEDMATLKAELLEAINRRNGDGNK